MKTQEKQMRKFPVDFPFDWTYGVEISKLKEDIAQLEKLGATHVVIETESSYGDYYVHIEAFCERIETHEECKARLDATRIKQEAQEARELALLEQLKKKYES